MRGFFVGRYPTKKPTIWISSEVGALIMVAFGAYTGSWSNKRAVGALGFVEGSMPKPMSVA